MKKFLCFTIILMCIISGFACAQNNRTITFDGVTYQVVTKPTDFIQAFINQKSAAIIYKINDYLEVGREIMGEAERLGLDVTQVYDPTTLVRAQNMQLIPRAEIFRLMMPDATIISPNSGNTVNSNIEVYMFNKVRAVSTISRTESANNLLVYYKYVAREWWQTLDAQERNNRICDSCYHGIAYGDGYIYGYIAGDVIRSWRLWCDNCMKTRVQGYSDNGLYTEEGGFFESEDVRRANDYANR